VRQADPHSWRRMLALPLSLALFASCGGSEPAAPDGAAPPVELGRGGTKGSTSSITILMDVVGRVGDPVPFYFSGDVTFLLDNRLDSGTEISPSRGTAILDDHSDPTLSNTRTWPSLDAGTYYVQVTGLPTNLGPPGGVICDPITASDADPSTPPYMAPEQGAADPHVDHRAEIYALGCLASSAA